VGDGEIVGSVFLSTLLENCALRGKGGDGSRRGGEGVVFFPFLSVEGEKNTSSYFIYGRKRGFEHEDVFVKAK